MAEDLARKRDDTPVTTGSQALITLACTSPVQFCSDCLTITGPSESSVTLLGNPGQDSSQAVYRMLVKWPAPYAGTVQIDAQSRRCTFLFSNGVKGLSLLLALHLLIEDVVYSSWTCTIIFIHSFQFNSIQSIVHSLVTLILYYMSSLQEAEVIPELLPLCRSEQQCSLSLVSSCTPRSGQIPTVVPLVIETALSIANNSTVSSFSYQCAYDVCRFEV